MTLEEAIKHCEEVAETQEENCKYAGHDHYTKLEASACAAEHRQLAEWLKELKELRERSASETNDGDMLSRQSLIYSFKYDDNGEPWSIDDVIYRLEQFPSVREEPLDTGDTIYRQAAIDALEEYADRLQMVNWKENPGVPYKAYALNWCINTIRDLPSAQPEPCEDAVSRTDVEHEIANILRGIFVEYQDIAKKTASKLQSVTPKRKTGKWNFIGDQMFECTECGTCYTQNQFHQMMVRITDPEFPNFCPNCGADMRGEQDG